METIVIAGVGLIGGSFGLALRRAGFSGRIVGVSSPPTIQTAIRRGAIDEGAPLAEAVAQADLVLLAQPISVILQVLPEVAARLKPGALVTDAGSTKRAIVEEAEKHFPPGAFLGGHPMAGKAERGVGVAEAGLFEGRPWILTPVRREDEETERARWLQAWIGALGARLMVLTPVQHDRVVAAASHLPQLASSALAALLDDSPESALARAAAGPGLHDMTRLALSDAGLWRDICATNQEEIRRLLREYAARLSGLADQFEPASLDALFRSANRFASQLRNSASDRKK